MMKMKTPIPLLAAVLLFAPLSRAELHLPPAATNQFYFEKDLVFELRLVGRWNGVRHADDCMEIQRRDARSYLVKYHVPTNQTGVLHLVKFRDQFFMDVFIDEPLFGGRVHLLMHVEQFEPTLKFAVLSEDRIDELLQEKPFSRRRWFGLRHGPVRKDAAELMSAPTRELRAFILTHLSDTKLFELSSDPPEFRRVSIPPENTKPSSKPL